MDSLTQNVLALDLKNLTESERQWLHDLKARAFKESLAHDFQNMKRATGQR